jgi:NTP pyrophosphatase (non-canonical NTP hydrolase)
MSDPLGKEPREYSVDRDAVAEFSRDMLDKMSKNRHKAHWNTVSNFWLLIRLKQEVEELHQALLSGDNIVGESADVANFAMMIADNVKNGK